MKEIPISQIGELDDFSVVKLINDDTQEFIGYYMHSRYQKEIEALWEATQNPSSSGQDTDGLDGLDAVKD
jgi:hypothetical protein